MNPQIKQKEIGNQVMVGLRPEDLKIIKKDPNTDNRTLSGEVETLLFLGDHFECTVKLKNDNQTMSTTLPKSTSIREGDHVQILINHETAQAWSS
jgi:ABC-type Fe3+/spermidine/putrescine transport system ATPase subunit